MDENSGKNLSFDDFDEFLLLSLELNASFILKLIYPVFSSHSSIFLISFYSFCSLLEISFLRASILLISLDKDLDYKMSTLRGSNSF